MRNISLSVCIIIFNCHIFACTCSPITKNKDYTRSDIVVIGQIIKVDQDASYFKVMVYETFKGNANDTIIAKLGECSIYPEEDEIWLLYARNLDKDTVFMSVCGFSRNITGIYDGKGYGLPEPIRQGTYTDDVMFITNSIDRGNSLNDTYLQIMDLRSRKQEKIIDVLSLSNQRQEKTIEQLTGQIRRNTRILVVTAILLIVQCIILLLMILKKK